jgi:hypothetical protein
LKANASETGSHYSILNQKLPNCTPTKGKSASESPSILSEKLLKNPSLKGWERLFVRTLAASPNPGKRQLLKLEAIALRLGHGGET